MMIIITMQRLLSICVLYRDILKEILGRENIMLFVFGDHGMTSTGMLIHNFDSKICYFLV